MSSFIFKLLACLMFVVLAGAASYIQPPLPPHNQIPVLGGHTHPIVGGWSKVPTSNLPHHVDAFVRRLKPILRGAIVRAL